MGLSLLHQDQDTIVLPSVNRSRAQVRQGANAVPQEDREPGQQRRRIPVDHQLYKRHHRIHLRHRRGGMVPERMGAQHLIPEQGGIGDMAGRRGAITPIPTQGFIILPRRNLRHIWSMVAILLMVLRRGIPMMKIMHVRGLDWRHPDHHPQVEITKRKMQSITLTHPGIGIIPSSRRIQVVLSSRPLEENRVLLLLKRNRRVSQGRVPRLKRQLRRV